MVGAIEAHIEESGVPRDVAMAKAQRYAREIVPAFNAYAYSRIGTRLARWVSNFIYRVRLGHHDDAALSDIDPEATVVFVMNHRSNMDYLLVTYLASASATLSYAVGEWARIWLLQSIIRAMGAYFIRRDSGNRLYRRVLARYVAMATRSGVTQAIFPEGGLSRNGMLRDPKFGLLGYMIGDYDRERDRDVVFVPVGLNYDRVLEDRILLAADAAKNNTKTQKKIGERTFQFGIWEVMRFCGHLLVLRLKGRLYRYGYACASFGRPISLNAWCEEHAATFAGQSRAQVFSNVDQFGRALMEQVGAAVPVLPVALVASVLEKAGEAGLDGLELKSRIFTLIVTLEKAGAHIHLPRADLDYAISTGLRMLTLRHIVQAKEGAYRVVEDNADLITYYANSIRHLLPAQPDDKPAA